MRGSNAWLMALVACGLAIPHAMACLPSDSSGPEPDTDHDGLSDREELEVYGTNPLMPDTDGDGYNDYQEVVTYGFDPSNDPDRFNPRVADVPQMTIIVTGPPLVTIITNLADGTTVTYDNSIADTATWGETWGPTWTWSQSNTMSFSQTNENDMSVMPMTQNTTSVTVPFGGGSLTVPAGPAGEPPADASDEGGPDATEEEEVETVDAGGGSLTQSQTNGTTLTFGNSVSTTVNPSTTIAASYQFTEQYLRQNAETVTRDQSLAQSHTITAVGASLKIPAVIENTSHIGFKVSNVFLSAVLVDRFGVMTAISNLELDQQLVTTFQPFALAAGASTGFVNFVDDTLAVNEALRILATGQALVIRLATYELDNADGKPFDLLTTDIGSKTALVAIDYGSGSKRPPELYQVATDFDPSHPGTTAGQIFQNILDVPYFASPETGLVAVRDVAVSTSGGPHWSVSLAHDSGPDITTTSWGDGVDPFDFDGIGVNAGDVLHLAYGGKTGTAASDAGVAAPQEGVGPPANASFHAVGPPPDAAVP